MDVLGVFFLCLMKSGINVSQSIKKTLANPSPTSLFWGKCCCESQWRVLILHPKPAIDGSLLTVGGDVHALDVWKKETIFKTLVNVSNIQTSVISLPCYFLFDACCGHLYTQNLLLLVFVVWG